MERNNYYPLLAAAAAAVLVALVVGYYVGTINRSTSNSNEPIITISDYAVCKDRKEILDASPLSFMCDGNGLFNLFAGDDTFFWIISSTTEKEGRIDIHSYSYVYDPSKDTASYLKLKGKIFSGTLSPRPNYVGYGTKSYMDALIKGLAQEGYVTVPFEIRLPQQQLIISPDYASGVNFTEIWDFVKVTNNQLYIIKAAFRDPTGIDPPEDSESLSFNIFVADPISVESLPTIIAIAKSEASGEMDVTTIIAPSETSREEMNVSKWDLEKIAMCGKTFTTDIVIKDRVDVGQRIALLATQEYERADQKNHTNCYFLKEYNKDFYLPLAVTEEISAEPNLKGKSIYLIDMRGDQYVIDRETNDVYNVNAMDGSTRNVIGKFK